MDCRVDAGLLDQRGKPDLVSHALSRGFNTGLNDLQCWILVAMGADGAAQD